MLEVTRRQWGEDLITSWNRHGWVDLPQRLGAKIARLLGAGTHEVVVADSTSVNLFKLLAAALDLRPGRHGVVSERFNFPTDLYVAQGLRGLLGERMELRLVASEELEAALDSIVAEHHPDRVVVALREGEEATWLEEGELEELPDEIDGVPLVRIRL